MYHTLRVIRNTYLIHNDVLRLPFSFRFPAFLGAGFCYSLISSRRHTPPAPLRAWDMCIPLACCFLSCVLNVDLFYFSSLPFFDFDLDIVCFILSFSCGYYAVSSVSVSAATRLAYDMYLDTYVCWSQPFYFIVWGTRFFFSVIVCFISCFYLFSSWGDLPHQIYLEPVLGPRLHCNDEFMWEQEVILAWCTREYWGVPSNLGTA